MRVPLIAQILWLLVLSPTIADAQVLENRYKQVPVYKSSVLSLFHGFGMTPWIKEFSYGGWGGDPKIVTLNGTNYELYSTCKPHDCGDKHFIVLFSPGGRQAWALLTQEGQANYLGNPQGPIREAINAEARAQYVNLESMRIQTAQQGSQTQNSAALQFGSVSAFCQSIIVMQNEARDLDRQWKNESNPLKQSAARERFSQRERQVRAGVLRSLDGAQAKNWTGKVTAFNFRGYSNGQAAEISISIPCNTPITLDFRFMDWDGNPHTKHEFAPLSQWRGFLENLSVGNSITFSARFFVGPPQNQEQLWLNQRFEFPGTITDIRKSP